MIVFVKYNVKKMTEYPMRDKSGQISSNTGETVLVPSQGSMYSDVTIIASPIYLAPNVRHNFSALLLI